MAVAEVTPDRTRLTGQLTTLLEFSDFPPEPFTETKRSRLACAGEDDPGTECRIHFKTAFTEKRKVRCSPYATILLDLFSIKLAPVSQDRVREGHAEMPGRRR